MLTIKLRRDFLAANSGRKIITSGFVLQLRKRPSNHPVKHVPRVGFTVTKKMGNAVTRNRIKRRLREAVRRLPPELWQEGCDYVLIARQAALTHEFSKLKHDMEFAFSKINANKNSSSCHPREGGDHAGMTKQKREM